MNIPQLTNYIAGVWTKPATKDDLAVVNPATGESLGRVPLSSVAEVDRAVEAASKAYREWRETPPADRIQPLFKFRRLLEEHQDRLARSITNECGKTYGEAVAEVRRAIENVEFACGIPSLMQGYNSEDIARGIDEMMIRQPLGVVAAITPFNFPAMVPLWFLPCAIACGNTFILKPSEKVPVTAWRFFELLEQTGLPPGVVNLVHGAKDSVDALLNHPAVRAVSFVGSSPVARYIFSRAAAAGKRAQCQGGAKNPVIVLPDADLEMTTQIVADSAFGCAGQRCLAASLAITVGEARQPFRESLAEAARVRVVGYGLDDGVQMGPVITPQSKERVEDLIGRGMGEGGRALVDGRNTRISGYEQGNFVRPTVLDGVPPAGTIARTEIFGPVVGLVHVQTIDDAIELVNASNYGNMACLFTSSGLAAREFRYKALAGNIGINLGVAAPMAYFPFGGMKESFFGDLHGQGRDAVDFYTEKKVVIERWPRHWSRKF